MYHQFYGLDYDPFRLTPSERDLFVHPSFEQAQAYLEYGLSRGEGFVVITGPPGSGKTTLARELVSRLPAATSSAQIETSQLEPLDLLRLVVARFGITPTSSDKAGLIEALRGELRRYANAGGRTVLIVDEAQGLPPESLEELRLLTNLVGQANQPLLQIVLLGQPALRELINRPNLEQLHQRTVASCRLEPLTEDEAIDFVGFRLRQAGWQGDPWLSTATIRLLYTAAEGIPRRLNLLASRLLLHGFADAKHRLTLDDAISVLEEMADESVASWRSRVDMLRQMEGREAGPSAIPEAPEPPPTEPIRSGTEPEPDGPAPSPGFSAEPVDTEPAREPAPDPDSGVSAQGAKRGDAVARESARESPDPVVEGPSDAPGRARASREPERERRQPVQPVHPPPRKRSAAVVISVTVAIIAVLMVVMAATPIGQTVETRLQAWFDYVGDEFADLSSRRSSAMGLPTLSTRRR